MTCSELRGTPWGLGLAILAEGNQVETGLKIILTLRLTKKIQQRNIRGMFEHMLETIKLLDCLRRKRTSNPSKNQHCYTPRMSSFILASKLSKFLPAAATASRSSCRPRTFVSASPARLKDEKENEETCQDVKEAADAVKDCAKEVKDTTKVIRDTAQSTAKSVKKAADKVSEAADNAKERVSGAWGTAKAATEIIKNKVVGK